MPDYEISPAGFGCPEIGMYTDQDGQTPHTDLTHIGYDFPTNLVCRANNIGTVQVLTMYFGIPGASTTNGVFNCNFFDECLSTTVLQTQSWHFNPGEPWEFYPPLRIYDHTFDYIISTRPNNTISDSENDPHYCGEYTYTHNVVC